MSTVFLCDDDPGVRGALAFLLRQHGFQVQAHASGPELLAAIDTLAAPVRGVFLLDVRMEPMSGPELHEQLIARGLKERNPVIFLSGHADVPLVVAAMRRGAVTFLEKPYADEALVAQLHEALAREADWQAEGRRADFLAGLWQDLTPQQARVATLVAEGDANKTIARKLAISERMVEVHRARVFERLGVDSAAAVATTVEKLRSRGLLGQAAPAS
ncbi:response regulator transcription factor [Ramlibacter rhizophilus]|uniref:Response regulator transcription factor n=1 Tax=Ramlibacter rhizophilus TaxID=1781167 RepID=A0A4Z0BVX7_9BURK|nr:response regulator [Ramlibacter rhizophilus]TFZ03477.1 response regulator transcription factor [Ramlibacter rhizophilus]